MRHRFAFILAFVTQLSGASSILNADESPVAPTHPFGKREHVVRQINGEREPVSMPAEIQWISEPWNRALPDENAQMPYLSYLPERDRIVMLLITHHPTHAALISSDDRGGTWSERSWLSTDSAGRPKPGIALGLTNLGDGKLMAYSEDVRHGRWVSSNFGETWNMLPAGDSANARYVWDPLLVVKNSRGQRSKLIEASWRPTGVPWGSATGAYSQGFLRTSIDDGQSWSEEVKVPQWLGVNEVNLIRASDGDLVAACRTDYPSRFAHHKLDHFGGLAVSRSRDEGRTWSDIEPLFEWGRHHPSMVLMPNGDIVMTYVVRLGYPATHEGSPRFGVGAVVSYDHGRNWDKDHRYILATWQGNITGAQAWFCNVQSTSTVLMPDGLLLTAFGTGFRNKSGAKRCKMDVALVRWRLNLKSAGD